MMTRGAKSWGRIETSQQFAEGIQFITTLTHRGYVLSNKRIITMRRNRLPAKKYYEEGDPKTAFLILGFPELFAATQYEQACQAAKDYYPLQYERFAGKPLKAEESLALQGRLPA